MYEVEPGRWLGSVSGGFDANGKRLRKTIAAPSKAKALEALERARAELTASKGDAEEALTVAAYLGDWIEMIRPTVRRETLDCYNRFADRHIITGDRQRAAQSDHAT